MNKLNPKEKGQAETVTSQSSLPPEITPIVQMMDDKSVVEGLKQQYTEVNNHIRHYSVLRFSIFTVFLAALGGLVSVSFKLLDFKYGNEIEIMLWGRIGGLLVTALFFFYELRIQALIDNSLGVGRDIESLLGYKHLSKRPSWGKYRSHSATRLFFLILILFWIAMIIDMSVKVIWSFQ
jgi:hypothetical protein